MQDNIIHTLESLKFKTSKPNFISQIGNFINSYRTQLTRFKKHMKSNWLTNSFHPSESTFIKSFDLPDNLIIREGDKNIGYVCLQTKELLNQYVKINLQQHFGKRLSQTPGT